MTFRRDTARAEVDQERARVAEAFQAEQAERERRAAEEAERERARQEERARVRAQEEEQIQRALEASRLDIGDADEDWELQLAMQASLRDS